MIVLSRESFIERGKMIPCHTAADWSDMLTVLQYHLGGRWRIFSGLAPGSFIVEVRNVWDAKHAEQITGKTRH